MSLPPTSPLNGKPLSQSTTSRAFTHNKVTGLSGNEIYCLSKMGMTPGNLCVGNSVFSLGVIGGLTSGLRNLAGGEVTEITSLIHEGRAKALQRMEAEAKEHAGMGITGVTTDLIAHPGNIEFLSIGSVVHLEGEPAGVKAFTTSTNAQELYCQMDSGFRPLQFVFGNVAYSIGIGGNIGGFFSSMSRGEVPEYSQIFDQTRHLALTRISNEAKKCGANAVVGIRTSIAPFMGTQEMLMLGTASHHPSLLNYAENPVTSDMTNEEMWNMVNIGYLPLRLVMGVSVYSLGLAGGIQSFFKSLTRGEVTPLTSLLYEAREKALDRIQQDAQRWGADQVVGVKTHVYDLGSGLIEFLAIGTAVKKVPGVTTKNQNLIPQAIIKDQDTYYESEFQVSLDSRSQGSAPKMQKGPISFLITIGAILFYIFIAFLKHR